MIDLFQKVIANEPERYPALAALRVKRFTAVKLEWPGGMNWCQIFRIPVRDRDIEGAFRKLADDIESVIKSDQRCDSGDVARVRLMAGAKSFRDDPEWIKDARLWWLRYPEYTELKEGCDLMHGWVTAECTLEVLT